MALDNLSYEITGPDRLATLPWGDIHDLHTAALVDALPDRSVENIEHLVDAHNPERYVQTRLDPSLLVGNEMRSHQTYREPNVVLAREDEQVVGYIYTALNVSGSLLTQAARKLHTPEGIAGKLSVPERFAKRLISPESEFIWHREIAVDPAYQGQGIARSLAMIGLMHRDLRHPSTAYTWPELFPSLYEKLQGLKFEDAGTQSTEPFGKAGGTVEMHRLKAHSRVLKHALLTGNPKTRNVVEDSLRSHKISL